MKKVISILLPCITMVFLFISCSKDDIDPIPPSLDKTEVTLYVDETISLTYSGSDCTWSSDNPLIASVKNGTITANLVGETIIHANDANCKVIVKPHYTKYYDPYIKWGEGKDEVKQYMRNYEIQKEENDQLTYNGDSNIPFYIYMFKNGSLSSCGMAINLFEAESFVNYLVERYIPVTIQDETYTFVSPDKKTLIGLQIQDLYLLAVFMPYNVSTQKAMTTKDIMPNIEYNFLEINQRIENQLQNNQSPKK